MTRWKASIIYRHTGGSKISVHEIEELDEIADIVEAGPHWDTVVSIAITRTVHSTLTVEEAACL